jgi:transposase
VLSVDEKSQIQALDRTQKTLPMQPGKAEKRTHDYVRHGTTTLFAALEIATGEVTGVCKPRHRHQEFLVFLRHVVRAYPGQDLHLIMDNYGTHKHPKVKAWLAANPRIHVHFTPTSGSWLKSGRGLVRDHRTPGHPPRHLRLGPRADDQDPDLHQRLERPLSTFCLDQDRR